MKLKKSYPLYLANCPVEAVDRLDVLDKFSGKRATRVAFADAALVRKAIVAGHKARAAMAAFPPDRRREVLLHCVRRFEERREALAEALCIEAGKPIRDARGEVTRLIETFQIAAEEAIRIGGEVMELGIGERTRGYRGMTRRVPVGLCSFITPFNFLFDRIEAAFQAPDPQARRACSTRQALGAEHQQGNEADEQQFTEADTEH